MCAQEKKCKYAMEEERNIYFANNKIMSVLRSYFTQNAKINEK